MPKLSVWMIRSSLIYLGFGFLVGALMLWNKGQPFEPQVWRLLNVHIETLMFGWMMQLAMGVAFWSLPRYPNTPHRYGAVKLGWVSYILVNLGIIITAGALYTGTAATWAFIGRCLLLGGVIAFVMLMWGRVKPYGV